VPSGGSELVALRSRDLMAWQMPDGHVRAVAVDGTNHQVADGSWRPVDLRYRSVAGRWVADENDFVATATSEGVSIADRAGAAVTWLGHLQDVAGSTAAIEIAGDRWTFANTRDGLSGTTVVAAPRGARSYAFPVEVRGTSLDVADGGALASTSLRIERPFAFGADGVRYPGGAWQVDGTTLTFAFDDRQIPATAFPYVLDPTVVFPQPAFHGYQSVSSAAYPPGPADVARSTTYPMDRLHFATNQYYANSNDGRPYWSDQSFTRWDTSSIPDGVTIQSATVTPFIMSWHAEDDRRLVADWYDPGATIGPEDYVDTIVPTAMSFPINSLPAAGLNASGPGADQVLSLSNPKFVDTTGTSSLRWGVDGGRPFGWNSVVFAGDYQPYENFVGVHPPVLTIDYVCEECGPVQPGMPGMENMGPQAAAAPPVRPPDLPTDDPAAFEAASASSTPVPSCLAITYRGNAGEISVQTNPFSGSIQWGIKMFRESDNYGRWLVDVYVGTKRFDHKDQWYNPHGSIPASYAKPGRHIKILADLYALQPNGETAHFFNVPNECVVPNR
jgi:hypothetical protein